MCPNVVNILRAQRNCSSPEAEAKLGSFLFYTQTFAFAPFYYRLSVLTCNLGRTCAHSSQSSVRVSMEGKTEAHIIRYSLTPTAIMLTHSGLDHSSILITIFNIYSSGYIYLNILSIVKKKKKSLLYDRVYQVE